MGFFDGTPNVSAVKTSMSKNAASMVRGAVGVPAQRVRHADLVEIAQALRDEDD